MTLNKAIVFTYSIVFFLCGCKEQHEAEDNLIRINPHEAKEEINLSEFVDSVKYIPLQTDDNSIVGRVYSVTIKENFIYVRDVSDIDRQVIFVFDKEGNFVSKLDKYGRGPGEYSYMMGFIVDDNEEYVEVISFLGGGEARVLKYKNISFDFVDEYTVPDINFNSVRKKDSLYYFYTQQLDNWVNDEKTNAGLIIVKDGKIEKILFDKTIETGGSSYGSIWENFTKNDNNELFVSIMYDNTFYRLSDMEAEPILTVDFGRYGIDNSIGLKPLQEQMEYLRTSSGLASFPVLNINNSGIMAFSYYFLTEDNEKRHPSIIDLHQYIHLKNSNRVYHTKRIKNDITGFPEEAFICTYNFVGHEAWHDDYLVDIVVPGIYFSDKEKTKKYVEGLGEISINDNPVIVLMKPGENM